jgi:hypothetical protein
MADWTIEDMRGGSLGMRRLRTCIWVRRGIEDMLRPAREAMISIRLKAISSWSGSEETRVEGRER